MKTLRPASRTSLAFLAIGFLLGLLLTIGWQNRHMNRHMEKMKFKHFLAVLTAVAVLHAPKTAQAQNNGTLTGTVSFPSAASVSNTNNASNFSQTATSASSASYIVLPYPGPYTMTANSSWTIECRFESTDSTNDLYPVALFPNTGGGLSIRTQAGVLSAVIGANPSTLTLTSGNHICDGAWHTLALVCQGGTAYNLYLDGVSVASGSASSSSVTNGGVSVINYGAESVDEVRFSNVARYTTNYTPAAQPFVADASTRGLYHLNGDATDTSATPPASFYADNSAFQYSPGNWAASGAGAASLAVSPNPGAYCRFLLSGTTTLSLKFSTGANAGLNLAAMAVPERVKVRLDGGDWQDFLVTTTVPVTLSTRLSGRAQPFLVEIIYKSTGMSGERWGASSPLASYIAFAGITVDAGATVAAAPVYAKRVFVFGDSITEGLHNLSTDSDASLADDASLGWAFLLRDKLSAEIGIAAYSGQALTNTSSPLQPAGGTTYSGVYSGAARALSGYDLFIFGWGANDGGNAGFAAALTTIINSCKAASPSAKTLVWADYLARTNTGESAAAIATSSLYANGLIGYVSTATDSLDSIHPTATADETKMLPVIGGAAATLLYGGAGGAKRRVQ